MYWWELTENYSCAALSSTYDTQCTGDDDDVINAEDCCPETEGVAIANGCSEEQILKVKPSKDPKKINRGLFQVFLRKIGWARD